VIDTLSISDNLAVIAF